MSVIQAQGTPEQIKKWYDPAKRLAIIGCYAQTELRLVFPLPFFCFVWFISSFWKQPWIERGRTKDSCFI